MPEDADWDKPAWSLPLIRSDHCWHDITTCYSSQQGVSRCVMCSCRDRTLRAAFGIVKTGRNTKWSELSVLSTGTTFLLGMLDVSRPSSTSQNQNISDP